MKFYKKILPLLALTGIILAGCGAQNHHTAHRSSEQTQSQMTPQKTQVSHDLNNDQNGAKQQHYSTQTQAKQGIQQKVNQQPAVQVTQKQSSANQDPNAINLGHNITGHQDRGAGQTYVSFKMGRWQIIVHGNDVNENADSAVQHAKNIVSYLQDHTLPIPTSQGIIQVDLSDNSTRISWDQNNKVNTLNGKLDTTLQKAVSLK